MSKVQSGLILIGVGVVLNVVGRIILTATRNGTPNAALASIMAIWMVASVVLVLFGLFRVVVGAINRNRT